MIAMDVSSRLTGRRRARCVTRALSAGAVAAVLCAGPVAAVFWASPAAASPAPAGVTPVPPGASAAVVTNVYPDAQDPAIADSLRTAATATVLGREVVLHLADAEDMALASVDNGAAADEVWLDRSFDGGLSWSEGERLGLSTVPAGATTARTMMYNIDHYQAPDSTTLRLGAVRACVRPQDHPDASCTRWIGSTSWLCDLHCDVRDPVLAAADRRALSATHGSRLVSLHVSDPDRMGWAGIEQGSVGDEVWLDRSFDGGQTWVFGSRLGVTAVPAAGDRAQTTMYSIDDPASLAIGSVRACAKASDNGDVWCTPWTRWSRSGASPQATAATALVQFWSRATGTWSHATVEGRRAEPFTWQDANALTALTEYLQRTGDRAYRYVVRATYVHNVGLATVPFTNDFSDDTGWWGLAWLRVFDYTGDETYLRLARGAAEHMTSFWTTLCAGGVAWSTTQPVKNAISNELYLTLNAALHNHIPGDTVYLQRARETWAWFSASGLINADHLVNDGLSLSTCLNNGRRTWSYNQGVILGGLIELGRATGDAALARIANDIARAAVTRLSVGGVLSEPTRDTCTNGDSSSFKGVFVRYLDQLDRRAAWPTGKYRRYLANQAFSVVTRATSPNHQSGIDWAGGQPLDGNIRGSVGFPCQQSGLDAINAAALTIRH